MSHSLLSPSAAHRWAVCAASVALCKGYEETDSEYANEGTLAHALAYSMFTGETEPEGVTDEMRGYIKTYIDNIKIMSQGAAFTWVEQKLDLSGVLGVPDQAGTGDYIAIVGKQLQVHDLKYGKGVKVSATNNWQLILYALGALDFVDLLGHEIESVLIVIHQVRVGEPDECHYTVEELQEMGAFLRGQAKGVMEVYEAYNRHPNMKIPESCFRPGEKQCRFCPAKADCKALQNFALSSISDAFEDLTSSDLLQAQVVESIDSIPDASAERLSILLKNLDLIQQWVSAINDRAYKLMLDGVEIPDFKLVEGRAGARKWSDDKIAEDTMKSMRLKQDEMYTHKIISPTVAEKLLKDSVRKWNRLKGLITTSEGAPTIAPASDKRPALVLKAQADDFEDLTGAPEVGIDLANKEEASAAVVTADASIDDLL